jgi:hypothetical protein
MRYETEMGGEQLRAEIGIYERAHGAGRQAGRLGS